MKSNIKYGTSTSDATATANEILKGYTAYTANGNLTTGTWEPIVKYYPSGNDAKWKWELYSKSGTYPTVATLNTKTPSQTRYYADSSTSISMNISDSYSAKCTIYGYLEVDTTASLLFSTDDGGTLTVNDVQLGTCVSCSTATYSADLKKGWNKIEVCYTEGSGGDGWYCNYNSKRIAVSGLFTAITSTLVPLVSNNPSDPAPIVNYAN